MTGSSSTTATSARGAGFSGIPEACASGLMAIGVLTDPGFAHGVSAPLIGLSVCAVAGVSGRWPYLATLLTSLLLGVSHALSLTEGRLELGLAYLTAFVVVEAIATTGSTAWTLATVLFHAGLWSTSLIFVQRTDASAIVELFVTLMLLGLAVGIGRLRFHWRDERRAFASKQMATMAAMRKDIARDLHDSIAHDITVIVLTAGQARSAAPTSAIQLQLDDIITTGQRSLHDLRAMLSVLRRADQAEEPVWHVAKPAAELEHSAERLREAGFIPDVKAIGDLGLLPVLVDEVISKCLVECISNVIKHGKRGSTCTVRLEIGQESAGLVPEADQAVELMVLNHRGDQIVHQGGLGLVGIAERVEAAGGSVDSGPQGNGLFATHVTLPIRKYRSTGTSDGTTQPGGFLG